MGCIVRNLTRTLRKKRICNVRNITIANPSGGGFSFFLVVDLKCGWGGFECEEEAAMEGWEIRVDCGDL
ncbi:hypothetical protein L873DRAFT_1797103 [Choiromyces venosus 120613-1]|uniref:Uncharacterized protein n=1 Tax=Choiromyces venosus 120613-1 TaxID=1336337 RepID=A0A3N4K6I1_9PEZI|nr:hypothetical protein L873DRAFT_1797103 [Choiromyces venosus 120613-1]